MQTSSLLFLIGTGVLAWAWWSHRAAAEAAVRHGVAACEAAGVQWLDGSVQLTGLRIVREPDGRLALERAYRFDYSRRGDDRLRGRIVMVGERLRSLAGPAPAGPAGLDGPAT